MVDCIENYIISASGPAAGKVELVWLCKICAESREMWKKSGAWFFKGPPRGEREASPGPPPAGARQQERRYTVYRPAVRTARTEQGESGEQEESSEDEGELAR